jgi:hypothetical protein
MSSLSHQSLFTNSTKDREMPNTILKISAQEVNVAQSGGLFFVR